jgi:ribosome-binding factor A
MDPHRAERVSEALREELAELIGYEMSDPRVANLTVTDVFVSPDLKHAQVRLAMPCDEDRRKDALAALEHARGFLKRELAHRLQMFKLPELRFEADVSPELAGRLQQLLKRVRKGRPRE